VDDGPADRFFDSEDSDEPIQAVLIVSSAYDRCFLSLVKMFLDRVVCNTEVKFSNICIIEPIGHEIHILVLYENKHLFWVPCTSYSLFLLLLVFVCANCDHQLSSLFC
jgi:hypothetical protein